MSLSWFAQQSKPLAAGNVPLCSRKVSRGLTCRIGALRGGVVVEVEAGDTLWAIAQRHRVDVDDLVRANGGTDLIFPGQKISLPTSGRPSSTSYATISLFPLPGDGHVVESGAAGLGSSLLSFPMLGLLFMGACLMDNKYPIGDAAEVAAKQLSKLTLKTRSDGSSVTTLAASGVDADATVSREEGERIAAASCFLQRHRQARMSRAKYMSYIRGVALFNRDYARMTSKRLMYYYY